MNNGSGILLVVAVAVVGVFHSAVPDHWAPIALLAWQRGWSTGETARAALQAGIGHVATTLILGLVVWVAGVAVAARFGHWVDAAASTALVVFGGWIAISAWRELSSGHGHSHGSFGAHHHHAEQADGGRRSHAFGPVHGPELQRIDTGHGVADLSIFESSIPPRFRFTGATVDWLRVETLRVHPESYVQRPRRRSRMMAEAA